MRDTNRIEIILDKLKIYWVKNHDLILKAIEEELRNIELKKK